MGTIAKLARQLSNRKSQTVGDPCENWPAVDEIRPADAGHCRMRKVPCTTILESQSLSCFEQIVRASRELMLDTIRFAHSESLLSVSHMAFGRRHSY